MAEVLLSFTATGSALGRHLAQELAGRGFVVSVDQRGPYGNEAGLRSLRANMRKAVACIVIAMPGELEDDPWISFELGLAIGAKRNVYLVSSEIDKLRANPLLSKAAQLVPLSLEALSICLRDPCANKFLEPGGRTEEAPEADHRQLVSA